MLVGYTQPTAEDGGSCWKPSANAGDPGRNRKLPPALS